MKYPLILSSAILLQACATHQTANHDGPVQTRPAPPLPAVVLTDGRAPFKLCAYCTEPLPTPKTAVVSLPPPANVAPASKKGLPDELTRLIAAEQAMAAQQQKALAEKTVPVAEDAVPAEPLAPAPVSEKLEFVLHFAHNQAVMSLSERKALAAWVATLPKLHPDDRLSFDGWTDDTGSAKVNKRMSQLRAQQAAMALHSLLPFTKPQRTIAGHGQCCEPLPNGTATDREQQRRVLITYTVHKALP